MRVIAGEFRSRRLKSIPGLDTRPTPDRLRESLFSVLGDEVQGKVFADLYAGTGAVGIEALSRGAREVIFVERAAKALTALRENLESLRVADRTKIWPEPVTKALRRLRADFVFLDPPYEKQDEYLACLDALAGSAARLVMVQHERRLSLPDEAGNLSRVRMLKQGDNVVSFYRPQDAATSSGAGASE